MRKELESPSVLRRNASMLQVSAAARCVIAVVVSVMLWAVVLWAMEGV